MKASLAALLALISVGHICSYSESPDPSFPGSAARVQSDLQALETQLKLYQAVNGLLPTTGQGLQALVTPPVPKPAHWLRLLDKTPLDPWGHPYLYKNPGVHNPNSYDLYSAGPDGKPDTNDDIGNW